MVNHRSSPGSNDQQSNLWSEVIRSTPRLQLRRQDLVYSFRHLGRFPSTTCSTRTFLSYHRCRMRERIMMVNSPQDLIAITRYHECKARYASPYEEAHEQILIWMRPLFVSHAAYAAGHWSSRVCVRRRAGIFFPPSPWELRGIRTPPCYRSHHFCSIFSFLPSLSISSSSTNFSTS